jgi:hypothetical protein
VFTKIQLADDAYYRCVVNNVSDEPAFSSALSLNVNAIPAPVISSFTPTVGRSGEFIRVTGQFFNYIKAVALVPTVGSPVGATYVVESSTSLLVTIPGAAPGAGASLRLTNRGTLSQSTLSVGSFRRSNGYENDYLNPRILIGPNQLALLGDNTGLNDPIEGRSMAWYSWQAPSAGTYRLEAQSDNYDLIFVIQRPNTNGTYTRIYHDSPVYAAQEFYTFTVPANLVGRTFYFGIGAFLDGVLPTEGPYLMNLYQTAVAPMPVPEGLTEPEADQPGVSITSFQSMESSWLAESGNGGFSLTTDEDGQEAVRLGGVSMSGEPVVLYSEDLPESAVQATFVRASFHAGLERVGADVTDVFAWQVSAADGSPLLQVRLRSADGAVELVQADGTTTSTETVLTAGSCQYFDIVLDLVLGTWTASMNGVSLAPALPLPAGTTVGDLSAVWYPGEGKASAMTFDRVSLQTN